MVTWIFAALGVYLVSILAGVFAYFPAEGLMSRLGSRDASPTPTGVARRLDRATANLKESLFFFVPLAFLALIVPTANVDQAVLGAQIFVVARLAYIPAYAVSVFAVRSLVWGVGLIGLVLMALAVI